MFGSKRLRKKLNIAGAGWLANSVDPDQILVYTFCSGPSVSILSIYKVSFGYCLICSHVSRSGRVVDRICLRQGLDIVGASQNSR